MIMNTTIIFVIFNLFSFSFDFPFFFLLLDSNQVPSFVRTFTLLSFVETSIVIVMDRLRRNEKLSIPYFFFSFSRIEKAYLWISLVEIVRIIELILGKIRSCISLFCLFLIIYKKICIFTDLRLNRSCSYLSLFILIFEMMVIKDRRWRRRKWQKLCSTESRKNGRNGWYLAPFCSGQRHKGDASNYISDDYAARKMLNRTRVYCIPRLY